MFVNKDYEKIATSSKLCAKSPTPKYTTLKKRGSDD
jgi:hypothetical protein